ncbi:MAG: VanZ family protein [Nitrospirae bacterium]|nr:VanZ family protein [Nitrospirota bacterium]MBI3378221.1 VanZ family protein [Nitrospirota bacterium]
MADKVRIKIVLSWSATISYMVLIFYFSSLSRPIKYELPYGADKIIHFIEYAVLGFLMAYSLKNSGVRRYILFGWALASIYGITDEIHQSFVPMRDASVYDIVADSIGSFAGAYFLKKYIETHNE